jgi:hypothetical protein
MALHIIYVLIQQANLPTTIRFRLREENGADFDILVPNLHRKELYYVTIWELNLKPKYFYFCILYFS